MNYITPDDTFEVVAGDFKYKLTILADEDIENPRNYDNLWTLVTAHKRYSLGDKQISSAEDLPAALDELGIDEDSCLRVPIYMYDHSGIALSTTPFNDRFDSGQLGEAFLPLSTMREAFPGGSDEKVAAAAKECLAGELRVYDDYINGRGFGFTLEKIPLGGSAPSGDNAADGNEKWEEEDTCFGFYGVDLEDNGILDHLQNDVLDALNEKYGIIVEEWKTEPPESRQSRPRKMR